MSASSVISRNNVIAGTFLIASIILALAIAFILGDIMGKFGAKSEYTVRFPTNVGVTGLKKGAEVTFAGLPVGEVLSVEPSMETDPNTGVSVPVAMDVRISIDTRITLHEDATADLSPPILGGVSRINIPSAGTGSYEHGPADSNAVLDPGETIRGRFAPSILAQLGFSTEEAEKIKAMIDTAKQITDNANEVSASVRRMATTLEPDFETSVEDGQMTIANIRAFTEKLSGEGGWSSRIDGWSTRVDGVFDKANTVMDDAGTITADAKSATSSIKDMIDTNRGRIDNIIVDTEGTISNIRAQINPTTDRVNELLDKGTLALGSYNDLAGNANTILLDARPKVSSTLDTLQLVGAQGSLFVEEIRSQPWRLMNKPSREELRREPLYEAARTYATAVADLRAASEALDAAVSGQVSGVNAQDIARIAQVVDAAYGRYETAEGGLLNALKQPPAP